MRLGQDQQTGVGHRHHRRGGVVREPVRPTSPATTRLPLSSPATAISNPRVRSPGRSSRSPARTSNRLGLRQHRFHLAGSEPSEQRQLRELPCRAPLNERRECAPRVGRAGTLALGRVQVRWNWDPTRAPPGRPDTAPTRDGAANGRGGTGGHEVAPDHDDRQLEPVRAVEPRASCTAGTPCARRTGAGPDSCRRS